MALVLAIEPDLRQAAIVKRVIKEKVQADVAVVDSRDAAIEAIRARVPDVLLLSVLLSPRDEQELIAHLRTLDNAEHLQTHTIPQLASSLQRSEEGQGLLGRFRRKKGPSIAEGCDPDVFADEVRVFLNRAEEKKRERELYPQRSIVKEITQAQTVVEAAPEPAPAAGSSWDSPFEWPASGTSPARTSAPREPLIATPDRRTAPLEPLITPAEAPVASSEPLIALPDSLLASPDSPLASRESHASPDSPIRHSSLVTGSPVSSIHDRVEFPSTTVAAATAASARTPEPEPEALPEPLPEPPPDTLAPFFMFDRARGLRREAARWLRVDAGAKTGTRGLKRETDPSEQPMAMADPIHVRIRTIRVQPAA